MRGIRLLLAAFVIAALVLGGCAAKETPEPAAKKPVTQKKAPEPAKVDQEIKKAVEKASTIKVSKGKEVLDKSVERYAYDPVNKPDPFRPYKAEGVGGDIVTANPLLKYEVRYFRLVGVFLDEAEPRALFEDPNGRAYILHIGDRIGRGGGVVQSIVKDTVIVTEERISSMSDVGTETVQIPIKLHPEEHK